MALAPIAGVVAVSETIPLWVIFLSIGVMFWVAGFDLLYSLQIGRASCRERVS